MGKFKPGISGNPGGRPKGSANKISIELRDRLANFLRSEFENMKRGFKKLPEEKRVKVYSDFLIFVLPKLQNTSLDFDRMTDEELVSIVNELKKAANEQPKRNY